MNKLSHDTDLLNLPQHNLEVYVMYFGNKGIQQRPFTLYHFLSNSKDRKSTRLNSSHIEESRMPSSA